ncbi:hypothetical protein KFE26_23080 [Shewanella sp. M16]|uniref:hypothetical protein n=1 Tax=Shewanella sp. M16 TaxID=2830837 RepID=UPI001BAEFEBD|nr:hypothetical protein [Shewanella sp. M16]MBS0045135.1 hypothetical protein [Shewanella sp. M16]
MKSTNDSSPARAAARAAARIKRQKLRAKKREVAAFVKIQKKNVGSSPYAASLEGFNRAKAMPRYFFELINNARQVIYSRNFETDNGGVSSQMSDRTKRKLFQIVVTILTTCDLISGQVGKPKEIGMDTTSHDALMLQHAKRWGEAVPSSTWYRYIDLLKTAGVFVVKEVKQQSEDGQTVRSRAAYKWLSDKFLTAIGAKAHHLTPQIKASRQKQEKKGLCFEWRQFIKKLPINKRFTADLFADSVSPPPLH